MKNIIKLILLSLLSISGFAQLPIKGNEAYFNGIKESFNESTVLKDGGKVLTQEALLDRIKREGDQWVGAASNTIRWNGNGGSGGQNIGSGGIGNSGIKGLWAESYTCSSSEDVLAQISGPYLVNVPPTNTVIGSSFIQSGKIMIPKSGSLTIPLRMLFDPHHSATGISLLQVFDQDPKISIPSISANVALTYNKNGGASSNNTIVAGEKYSCLFNILNSSGSPTSGTITVVDKIPPQCRYVSSSGTGWTIGVVGDVLTATTSDVIANGGTKPFTVVYESTKLVTLASSIFGYLVDIDIMTNAPPIWVCGTSISAGSSASSYETHFTYLFKHWLRDVKGVQSRMFNRAIGGTSSVSQELLRKTNNRYETLENPLLAIYENGVNEGAQSVSNATTIANMQSYVKHVRRRSATCPILILAPFPTGNAPYEALNQSLHVVYGPAVAALNDPKVYYVSTTRNMWNAVSENSTYTTDNIHPNDVGNQRIFETISAFISANNIF